MRLLSFFVVLLVWVAVSAGAAQRELDLSLRASTSFDSNISGSDTNERGGVGLLTNPKGEFYSQHRFFAYRLMYQPTYEYFLNRNEDRLDHVVRANLRFALSDQTRVTLTNSFRSVEGVGRDGGGGEESDVSTGNERRNRNSLVGSLHHAFTNRLSSNLTGAYHIVGFDQSDRNDSTTMTGRGSVNYQLGLSDTVGLGGSMIYQDFQGTIRQPGTETKTYNISASWIHRFTPTTSFSIRGGPTILDNQQQGSVNEVEVSRLPGAEGGLIDFSECENGGPGRLINDCATGSSDVLVPVGFNEPVTVSFPGGSAPPAPDDLRFTFFGGASFNYSYRDWSSSLSYNRSQSPAGAVGTSTILDSVRGTVKWRPRPGWRTSLSAGWSHRQSISDSRLTRLVVEDSGLLSCRFDDLSAGSCDPGTLRPVAESTSLFSEKTSNAVDVDNWYTTAAVTWEFVRRMTATLQFRYTQQKSKSEVSFVNDVTRYRLNLILSYSPEAFQF